jgi:hypothetical protein
VIVLVLLLPAAAAADWNLETEGRIGAGSGEQQAARCCPASRRFTWGGIGGRLEASPARFGRSRLLLAGQGDLRVGHLRGLGEENDRGAIFVAATAGAGWDWTRFGFVAGGYVANLGDERPARLLPSASIRIGNRATYFLSLDLLDEPACFLPTCIVGLSYGLVFEGDAVMRHGFSLGKDKGRSWVLVPFRAAGRWWVVGGELDVAEEGPGAWLVFGVRSPWPTKPRRRGAGDVRR